MILTQTPLRVSLFGGGSDYPEWFMEHGGAVLGMAINKYVYVGVQDMHPGQTSRYRVQYSKVDDCQTVAEIKHPAVRAALQYYNIDTPLEFHCFGDMPGGAGLGSSSAFCVGALKVLQYHCHIPAPSQLDLASEAIAFERHMIPETVGYQDQIFAALGGINFITFDAFGAIVQKLHPTNGRILELEQSLVLVYSGETRNAHAMAAKQVAEIPNKHQVLSRLMALAKLGKDVLLDSKEHVSTIGWMLHQAWMSKIKLCPEVTTPAINKLYEHGLNCGALGGKLLGAGGGGFILFFVPPEQQAKFEQHIGTPCFKFQITNTGSQVVHLKNVNSD